MNEVDELLLKHFGVKGMHWGIRNSSPKPSRKERRQAKKIAQTKAIQDKVDHLVNTSLKKPESVLILLNGMQVVTGKEFVQHLGSGGLLNVKTTRIYAQQQTNNGPFVLEPRN